MQQWREILQRLHEVHERFVAMSEWLDIVVPCFGHCVVAFVRML